MSIQLTYPDGSEHGFEDGVTGFEVATSIGERLAQAAVAVALDGQQLDIHRPLPGGGEFAVITANSDAGRHIMRHSAAHVLAQAVLALHEGAAFAVIERGAVRNATVELERIQQMVEVTRMQVGR